MNPLTIFAACVLPRREMDTARDFRDKGFRAYVPCETMARTIMGRRHILRRPALPGYVFIEATRGDLPQIEAHEAVYNLVRYIGENGDRPAASIAASDLQPVFLAELFGDLDYTRSPEAWKPMRGDRVSVNRSMWMGRVGKIVRVMKRKVMVDLDGLGEVEVDKAAVQRAA